MGDPSDAWDHAIKAVEAILLPIVVPRQDQAKIGQVVGELGSKGDKWDVGLLFNQTDPAKAPPFQPVEALVGMLRLVYPNPDRHAGKDHQRAHGGGGPDRRAGGDNDRSMGARGPDREEVNESLLDPAVAGRTGYGVTFESRFRTQRSDNRRPP